MNEREAISVLERLIQSISHAGYSVENISRFFDVGEWLIAFEGVENILDKEMIEYDLEARRALSDYFRQD